MFYFSVFDYFLFNVVTISASELLKVHDYCVYDCFLFLFVTISGGELYKLKFMIIVCLTVFSSILSLSPFQEVSYIKCMIVVCITVSLQSCHHFRR